VHIFPVTIGKYSQVIVTAVRYDTIRYDDIYVHPKANIIL